jgi:hypothetical protein
MQHNPGDSHERHRSPRRQPRRGHLPPPGTAQQRQVVRRTSFVGAGFLGLRRPQLLGIARSVDELHPFIAVVSNAQDLREEWRPVADQQFNVHLSILQDHPPFLLHSAGQSVSQPERILLERGIRRCLDRVSHPEPVARLLARAVRAVSASAVSGNVCPGDAPVCARRR